MSTYCKCGMHHEEDDGRPCSNCAERISRKSKVRHAIKLILAELDASDEITTSEHDTNDEQWMAWRRAASNVENDVTARNMTYAAIGFCLRCRSDITNKESPNGN